MNSEIKQNWKHVSTDKPVWTKVTSKEANQRKVILKAPVRITQCTVNSHCFRLEVCYLSQWCLPAWACLDKSVGRRAADRGATGVMVSTMKAHLHRRRGPSIPLWSHGTHSQRGGPLQQLSQVSPDYLQHSVISTRMTTRIWVNSYASGTTVCEAGVNLQSPEVRWL